MNGVSLMCRVYWCVFVLRVVVVCVFARNACVEIIFIQG